MSKKSRERREKHKGSKVEDFFSNGVFEMARLGKNIVMRNSSTPEQHANQMEYLCSEYPSKYKHIEDSLLTLKEKVLRCNPYNLLMYLRDTATLSHINVMSEIDYSIKADSILRAQEYVQSVIVSSDLEKTSVISVDDAEKVYLQIIDEFEAIYVELQFFYQYWAAYIKKSTEISDERLKEIVEAQYMYWVRGNRYQVFELDPLKKLLPPHDAVLKRLFGVTSGDIISGLEKIQYALSQERADSVMKIFEEHTAFVDAVNSGAEPETVLESSEERVTNLLRKVFGSDLINVRLVTGWDERFIDFLSYTVGECKDFWNEGEFAGWPIVCLPVTRRPFIKLDGISYAFLYYALFDNIYRIIQKGIIQRECSYLDTWKEKQTSASEKMVCDLFLKLLPNAEAHIGNYYPVNNSLKQMNENDILLIYQNYLFVIEVKAGSFPPTPPITDFNAHIKAYHNLAEVADSQCSRTIAYIKKNSVSQFYDHEKNPTFQVPDYSGFDDVFTFSVTIDNFNEFAAKAEKLSIIFLKEDTIVISVDDLLVYTGYFDSSIYFLHYLKQRKAAMRISQYQMNDELDHLGLYIERNLYALNPFQYGEVKTVFCNGFRQSIDEYFNWMYTASEKAVKPTQNIPEVITDIIEYLESNISPQNIAFAHFLLDLSFDTRDNLSQQILCGIKRQRALKRQIPLISFSGIKYCVFISIPDIEKFTKEEQLDYVYAATSRDEKTPIMMISLNYDSNNSLVLAEGTKCSFSDVKDDDIERIRVLGQDKAKDWVQLAIKNFGKIGRNEYCPCGSGKKYKNCCWNA